MCPEADKEVNGTMPAAFSWGDERSPSAEREIAWCESTRHRRQGTREACVIILALILCVALAVAGNSTQAANGAPTLADLLTGNTLSAVAWVPHPAAASGRGALSRFMLQAYLQHNGSALMRVWDSTRNAYTRPLERNWTLSGSRLCLDLPNPGFGWICAEIHKWGPRIAGIGSAPYVMLDGDLKPGNAILGTH
jgi:hypothetical protein